MSLVLDSSTALSWCFEDEDNELADVVFGQVVEGGAVAPAVWRYEVANGLQMAVRRGRISPTYRDASLADLSQMEVRIDPEGDAHLWSTVVDLAEKHSLTVYDAAYLELAQRRRLPLATLDRALIRAAEAEGVKVVDS